MRPRVLLLIKGLGAGGAEHLLAAAAAHMNTTRFEYRLAHVLPEPVVHGKALARAGIPVECLARATPGGWLVALRRLLRAWDPDIVHVHSPYVAAAVRLMSGDRPVVYTEHNIWPSYRRPTRLANRVTFGRNAYVFAVSEHVMRSMNGRGARRAPIETLHHGIDHNAAIGWRHAAVDVRAELGLPPGAPVAVTVANLRAQKGHATLIDAAQSIKREVPGARLVLVGSGPLEADLRERARACGVEDVVIFAGHREDAREIVAGADLFVLPSLFDGLSIALLEAMALGRGIVFTAAGGNTEAARHEREALVIAPGDPDSLSRAVVRMLRDDALRGRLGAAAEDRAQAFDLGVAVRRQEQVYAELIDGRVG